MSVEDRTIPQAVADRQSAPGLTQPRRLWPAVILVGLFWTAFTLSGWLEIPTFFRFFTRLAAFPLLGLSFFGWWWLNRRVRLADRLYGFALVVAGGVGAYFLCHPSVGGFGLLMLGLPTVLTVWTLWMILAKRVPAVRGRLALLAVVAVTWGYFTLIRIDGLTGNLGGNVNWRWTPTAESLFLAEKSPSAGITSPAGPQSVTLAPGDWPGFRGPGRDDVVRGVTVATDWTAHPPRLVWRQRVGPAWSSVAVVGGRLFTQEQRGEREAVICYDAATGRELWAYEDTARFEEGVSGAGPRATPAFADGRLYTLGATGLLNCLDAASGRRLWSHDLVAEAGAKVPTWGVAGSPLVVAGVVVVYAGSEGGKSLLAYLAETGEPAWAADAGQASYSSPQLATLVGRPQVLALSDRGVTAVDPATGAVLWEHDVSLPGAPRSVQPQAVGPAQVLIASEADLGTALLDVTRDGDAWTVTRRWATKQLKPAFNDCVVHAGHAYGFDGNFFACVDLETGRRCWKGERYGHGQVVLLAEQGLLLVISESGQAILVAADPQRHQELGRFQAVNGKTWSHPVVAHGRLYVRNAEEMACYELGPANNHSTTARSPQQNPPAPSLPR
jgi:outer membrane protein assembly factor BamB